MSVYLRVSQRSPRIPEPWSTWVEGDQQQDQPIQLSWTSWFTNGPIMLSISFHLSAPQMAKRFFSACRWTLDWSFIHWLWHHGGPGLDAVVRSSSNLGLFPHVDRRVRCVHRQHRDNVVRRQMLTPFVHGSQDNVEVGAGTVTINLFVTTILELLLSILSIRVAFKGYRQRCV